MRIVMVAPFAIYPKGTVNVRILPIAKVLAKRGHEVAIVIPPYDNPSHSGLQWEVEGVKIFNVAFKDVKLVKYLLTSLRIVWRLFSLKPDVVYVFKPKGYSGLAAMLLIVLKRFGIFRSLRLVLDMDDWEGYGGFNDYYLMHGVYPRVMLDFFDFQERWIPKHVDAVTVASRVLERRVLSWGIPPVKVFYVPNGADLRSFNVNAGDVAALKRKLGLEGVPVILLYTRFFEYRVEKVVKILKYVRDELGDVKLLVVGKGEFGEEEQLKVLAKREGLSDAIVFAGWVQPKDLPLYLAVGDVAIYPFDDILLNRAKCPGKLVELMAAGKAIVADNVGQIAEYIENGESGFLVDSNDDRGFALSIINVLKDYVLRRKIGENARKRILNDFNWKGLTIRVEQALSQNFTTVKTNEV